MTNLDLRKESHGASRPHETFSSQSSSSTSSVDGSPDDPPTGETLANNIEQTLQLGNQFIRFAVGLMDLARTEIALAMHTIPNLMMLWLLMMPIMLLTWGAFSVLMAWLAYAASNSVGLGLLIFFLQQVLLLLVCRWWYLRYAKRMTLPYTRAHIDNFVRGMQHGSDSRSEAEK